MFVYPELPVDFDLRWLAEYVSNKKVFRTPPSIICFSEVLTPSLSKGFVPSPSLIVILILVT